MELKPNLTPDVDADIDDDAASAGAVAKQPRAAKSGLAGAPGALPAGATQLVPVDGVLRLPAGTRLDAVRVSGPNLIITLPDGQVLVVVDGALHPPQIILGTITISAANIAALIAGQEPEPAAGAPQSSGGNFIENPGDIGDPFGLGNLLPPTDFAFAPIEDRELIPAAIDNDPEISIVTPDQPLGSTTATATVSEAALAARGVEPAGSDPTSTAEMVTGIIQINSPDRPNVVAVNGTAITAVGQAISTPFGAITITSIAPDAIGYSYTLLDNSTTPETTEIVTITVTDDDGDVATATLTVTINDDAPTARADTENVAPSLYTAQVGNVVTGIGTASGAAGADTLGADGATVTGIRGSSATTFTASGTVIQGQYGTLLMLPSGHYSYVRSAGTPGGVADVFTYQLTDGDGDLSTATLTFTIGDGSVGLVVPSAGDEGTVVDEAGLPEREGETPGSRDGDGSNLTFGIITFDTPDGPAIITINGTTVTGVDQEITLPTGTLIIVAINSGSVEYAFVLTDNTAGGATTQPINVTVTDQDGDSASASFVIDILDDAPVAVADNDLLSAGDFAAATGNVIADAENDGGRDTQGADGATAISVSFDGNSGIVDGETPGAYGTLILNRDGSYSYTLDNENLDVVALDGTESLTEIFEYTISDSDGDESTATLTITIRGVDDIVVITGLNADGAEATVSEANLSDGSAPDEGALTRTGSFAFSAADGLAGMTVGGEPLFDGAIVDGLTLTTAHGTFTITDFDAELDANGDIVGGTISYNYVLNDNTLLHSGTNGGSLSENIAISITDSDGTVAASSVDIVIIDDNPIAANDEGDVGEGQTLAVDVSAGLQANDVLGADEAAIVGIRALDGDPVSPVNGGVGLVIAGLYGELTIAVDGSYSYVSDSNAVPPAGAVDVFVYTLRDGDGDLSTATLTINMSDSGLSATMVDLQVDEAGLDTGSDPNSANESVSGDLNENVTGGSGPFEFAIVGGGVGSRGIFELNPDGTYTYTLVAPVDGPFANDGNNVAPTVETFTYTVTDAFGNTSQNTIVIDVVDDVPIARSDPTETIAEDAPAISGDLLANDTQGADGAAVTSVTIGGVTIAIATTGPTTHVNTLGTYTFEPDGAWTFDPVSAASAMPLVADFTYTITDGDGDTSTALQQIRVVDGTNPTASTPISLTLDDQNLETGTTPSTDQPVFAVGEIQFTTGSDPIILIAFGDVTGLDGGLTWVRVSDIQIVGSDGDRPVVTLDLTVVGTTATVVATLESNYAFHPDIDADDLAELGLVNVVATDSDGDQVAGIVDVSVSDDVPSIIASAPATGLLNVDETDLSVNATADFLSLFNIVMGADQPGTISYSFSATNASTLVDVATGAPVTLHANGNVVEGRVAGLPGAVAFRLTVAANGQATLDQIRAVRHGDPTNPDDTASIPPQLIQLTVTVTDSDGDQARATINVGGALVFEDDGPSLDVTGVDTDNIILTTQDGETRGAAFDVATANLSSAFAVANANYGADGSNGAAVVWTYVLALGSGAAATGLTSNGVPVTLTLVAGEIVGSADGAPVFSVSVNPATGIVTLTQFAEIDHPLPGSSSNYASQILQLPPNLVELRGTASIVDRDGDSTTDTVAVDLGGNIRFADDGPSVTAGGDGPVLILDESFLAVDVSADLSGLFASTLDFGADGQGSVLYQLGVAAGPSGLIDSLTGEAVALSILDGVIYGRTTTHEVFRITVAANGVVTFDQSRAIIHSPDTGPDQTRFLGGANLITMTAIVTDGDGDIANSTVDITGRFGIRDDAVVAVNDADSVARDGQIFADGNVLTSLGGIDDNGTDGAADNAGADGGLLVSAIAFGANSGTLGSALAGNYGSLIITANGNYRYDLDVTDPAVIALNSNEMITDTFTYIATDADGDTSTATITISITGANDFPVGRADTNWVLDGTSGSDPSAAGNVLQDINHPGAPSGNFTDVADTDPDLEPITVTSAGTYIGLYGTLVIAANGSYTYTLNEDNVAVNALDAGQTLVDSFGYTISDGLLSVDSALTITVFGTNDAPTIGTTTARISEEGLLGGVADTAPDALLDTTNSVIFSGTLAINDLDAGEILTATLGNPGAALTAGGMPVTWAGVGTGTLVGSAGGNEVIRVTLASNGAYTVTLSRAVDHPVIALEDIREFAVPVSVSDGTITTINDSAIRVIIEDDAPTATGETGSSAQVQQDVNTLFILDFSDSIDDSELDTMLDAVQNALSLLDASALSALTIRFVIFASGSFASPSFTTAAEANAYLDSLNPAEGGTRPDSIGLNTNYTSAINTALANFSAMPAASNQVFFLSDGNPNQGVQFSPPNPPNLPTVINSLTNATATAWNSFVDGNNINVAVIGIDNDPASPLQLQRLADVDLNDAPNNVPILVEDFDALVATLLSVVVPAAVGGDLDLNDNYGADGGRLLSITVGTTTYVWDGASSIAVSSGGTIAGSILTAVTPMGGTLQLNFGTGQYNYQPPSPITVTATEDFAYTLTDNDGDTATATLSVTITALVPPAAMAAGPGETELPSSSAEVVPDPGRDGVSAMVAMFDSGNTIVNADLTKIGGVARDMHRGLLLNQPSLATALVAAGIATALPLAAEDSAISPSANPLLANDNGDVVGPVAEYLTVEAAANSNLWQDQISHDADARMSEAPVAPRQLDIAGYAVAESADPVAVSHLLGDTAVEDQMSGRGHQQQAAPSTDQVLLPSIVPQALTGPTAAEVSEMVADAIEGRTVDLDALLAAYVGPGQQHPQVLLQNSAPHGFFADYAMSASGDILLSNMAEQQVMAQLEQAATLGNA